jgi:hypothetical protein
MKVGSLSVGVNPFRPPSVAVGHGLVFDPTTHNPVSALSVAVGLGISVNVGVSWATGQTPSSLPVGVKPIAQRQVLSTA